MTTTLRVHFFEPGRDWLSRLVWFAGFATGRTPRFTHVAVSFPDQAEETESKLFHFEMGSAGWVDLLDLLKWSRGHEYIDITNHQSVDTTFGICYGLDMSGRGTTFKGLLQLFFKRERNQYNAQVCTDVVNLVRGRPAYLTAATPDELFELLTALYAQYPD